MTTSVPKPDVFTAERGVATEIARWLGHLGAERRMSDKTVEAYERDVRQFLMFMAEPLGGPPKLTELAKITPQDVRAFLAARELWVIEKGYDP
ncbi:MAG: site-specific integrase, partial [Hyphomicrobiales bacterium]